MIGPQQGEGETNDLVGKSPARVAGTPLIDYRVLSSLISLPL